MGKRTHIRLSEQLDSVSFSFFLSFLFFFFYFKKRKSGLFKFKFNSRICGLWIDLVAISYVFDYLEI